MGGAEPYSLRGVSSAAAIVNQTGSHSQRPAPSYSQPIPTSFLRAPHSAMNNSGDGIRWSAAKRAIPLRCTASDRIQCAGAWTLLFQNAATRGISEGAFREPWQIVEAADHAPMRRRSCGIFELWKSPAKSPGRAEAHARSKPGVFAFGSAFR
jgi:hypothetical protein